MQRLEFNGVVRPLKGSLGVKRLNINIDSRSLKFNVNSWIPLLKLMNVP